MGGYKRFRRITLLRSLLRVFLPTLPRSSFSCHDLTRAGRPDRGAVRLPRFHGQCPVSIFLTDARAKTLPIKMLQYIEESPDPSIAALSTPILIATLFLLFVADRAIGLHRLAGLEA